MPQHLVAKDLATQCLNLVQVAEPVMIPGVQSEDQTFSTGLSTESVAGEFEATVRGSGGIVSRKSDVPQPADRRGTSQSDPFFNLRSERRLLLCCPSFKSREEMPE